MQILLGQHLTVWAKDGPVHRRRRAAGDAPAEARGAQQGAASSPTSGWTSARRTRRSRGAGAARRPGDVRARLPPAAQRPGAPARRWTTRSACGCAWRRCGCCTAGRCRRRCTASRRCRRRSACAARPPRAYAINPTVGIAVDVCHATDTPGNDKKQLGEIKCGGGPVLFRGPNINPRVFDLLEATAKAHEIPVQVRGVPRATGTDANAIQISREGVATRPGRHPEPLHAQPGRGGSPRRPGQRRAAARRVLRRGRPGHQLDSVTRRAECSSRGVSDSAVWISFSDGSRPITSASDHDSRTRRIAAASIS